MISIELKKNEFILGTFIILLASISTLMQIVFCFFLIIKNISIQDAGLLAFISGLMGNINGYLLSNAQQVVGFFFGSSSDSSEKIKSSVDPINNR